uniref:RNase H type-1 domain-containing protein n=1 Tax=Scylla olivacea TaxID=85551 RepID=A0A0P4W0Y3_SCYOL
MGCSLCVRGEGRGGGDSDGLAAAAVADSVRDFSSSTQAELAAINIVLELAYTPHNLNTFIITDSMTAISTLDKEHCDNIHLTCAIYTMTQVLHNTGRTVTMTRVMSHVGIQGNKEADTLAKQAC